MPICIFWIKVSEPNQIIKVWACLWYVISFLLTSLWCPFNCKWLTKSSPVSKIYYNLSRIDVWSSITQEEHVSHNVSHNIFLLLDLYKLPQTILMRIFYQKAFVKSINATYIDRSMEFSTLLQDDLQRA
jgi:hypothetical protein